MEQATRANHLIRTRIQSGTRVEYGEGYNNQNNYTIEEMNLQQRDELHLWHPYTQHQTAAKPLGIVKGKDALLWGEDGKEYIDAIASWWVNPYGHSNERLAQAAYKQLTQLEHVLFGGFTHKPAVELAEKHNFMFFSSS